MKPWLKSRRFYAGAFLGAGAVLMVQAAVIAAMPDELAKRPIQATHVPKQPGAFKPLPNVPLSPYAEGWKDGVAFPGRPDIGLPGYEPGAYIVPEVATNDVPEPGTLALVAAGLMGIVRRKS